MARVPRLRPSLSGSDKRDPQPKNILLEWVPKTEFRKTRSSTEAAKPMTNDTIFLAVFRDENVRLQVHYKPWKEGLIWIVSYEIQERLLTPFKQRQNERRPGRRGLVPDAEEEQLEMLLPYTRRET
jgi:hypothetical protein